MIKNSMGNINNQGSGTAYMNTKENLRARHTNRQNTSVHYVGDAKGDDKGGYLVKKIVPKNTSRQYMADNEYTGNRGPGANKAPKDYSTTYNATVKSIRENIAKGRSPASQGPKSSVPKESVNMFTTRHGDNNNKKLEKRGIMSNKVYNSIPQQNQFGQTEFKDTLPNQPLSNRLDPKLLDPFKENPYTHSLQSHAL